MSEYYKYYEEQDLDFFYVKIDEFKAYTVMNNKSITEKGYKYFYYNKDFTKQKMIGDNTILFKESRYKEDVYFNRLKPILNETDLAKFMLVAG
jgi:hypothetical protein